MKKCIMPLFILLSTQLMAQSELKTKSISIFKNGKSFVVKEGKVTADKNGYTLPKIPNALFGTLWFIGLDSDVIQVSSKVEQANEMVERKAISFSDLLYANKGKNLTLTTDDNKTYTGMVEDFNLPEEVNSYLKLKETELNEKYSADIRLFTSETPVLLLKMDNKWISIAPSTIKTIEFSNKPENSIKMNIKVNKPLIKVQFVKEGNQQLRMMYLQNGIAWTPAYLLELVSDNEARLRLQAEVMNDAEDIANTNLNFVVGVPNFKFADQAATLTSFVERVYRDLSSQYDGRRSNMFSNAIMSQVAVDSYSEDISDEDRMSDVDADASEDLYFYTLNNITIEKGARAHYPLFNVPVKIKHLYECNLPSVQDDRNYPNFDDDSQLSFDIKHCNVFHSIEIKNNTKTPFTTGSVMIVEAKTQRPLSEDLLKYTGVGQTSSIQLTQSPDIRVEEQEKIVNVQQEAKKRNGYTYNLLTIQSEVVIVNSKKQDIEMLISKQVSGKGKSATVTYKSRQMPNGSNNINPLDKLTFNIPVKAGQTTRFTYTYEMYVRD